MVAQRNFSITAPGIDLSPREFSVTEGLSSLFVCTVKGLIPDPTIDLEKPIGKPASFSITNDKLTRYWNGVVAQCEQLHPAARGKQSRYAVTIRPVLWLAGHVQNHRIFQRESIPDIVEKVLKPYQITPKKKLTEEHPKHKYVVQYAESDLEFVMRLLENEGITYYFEHGPGESKLVLDDKPTEGPERASLEYAIRPHAEAKEDWISKVTYMRAVAPGKVTLRDYDFRKPDLRLEKTDQAGSALEKKLEHYYYVPGGFKIEESGGGGGVQDDHGKARHNAEEGQRLAKRTLAALRSQVSKKISFETSAIDVTTGTRFPIEHHPHPDFGGKKLLVDSMSIAGTEHGNWLFFGSAVFCDDPYAPARVTPRPRIKGVQSALVVGPKGEEIYTDEYGRVRVQFQWDREGKGVSEGKPSTCWMRVAQPWAGKGWGVITIPRIGHEVFVRYYDGDPDYPVVTSRTYNKLQPVPYTLPKHKAKSLWKTDTSKHKDNHYNEVRLDDRKDFELVYEQAQLDRQELVKRHETERTGISRAHAVGLSRSAIVRKKDVVLVGKEYSVQIIKKPSDREMEILAQRDTETPPQKKPRLEPKATKVDMMDKKIMVTTGKATVELDDKEIIFEAKGEISMKAGGRIVVFGGPFIKINC